VSADREPGGATDGPVEPPHPHDPADGSKHARSRSADGSEHARSRSSDGIEPARSLLAGARAIVVLTGAGVSAESGVPTFRGRGGMWKSRRPEELATPEAFATDPCTVWEWYAWRRSLIARCDPNAAHRALARLALTRPDEVTLITQNVDGLHHRAAWSEARRGGYGAPPRTAFPLEVHGALHRDRCSACGLRRDGARSVDSTSVDTLPHCPACAALLRPDVVWFGEPLDPDVLGRAFGAAGKADVCLVIGTSAVVHPVASVPEATLAAGGVIVEVNPDETPLSPVAAVSVRGPAGDVVPAIVT